MNIKNFKLRLFKTPNLAMLLASGIVFIFSINAKAEFRRKVIFEKTIPKARLVSSHFSGKNNSILLVHENGTIQVFDYDGLLIKETKIESKSPVTSSTFDSSSNALVLGYWNGNLSITKLAEWQMAREWGLHKESIGAIAISQDHRWIASGSSDDSAKIVDSNFEKQTLTLEQDNEYDVTCLSFSPDGEYLATGDGENMISIWDCGSGDLLMQMQDHKATISEIFWSSDGNQIISSSWDKKINRWDTRDGSLIQSVKHHESEISSMAYNQNLDFVASADDSGMVVLSDYKSLDKVYSEKISMNVNIRDLEFDYKGQLLSILTENKLILWSLVKTTH